MSRIHVKGWSDFQHYKHRSPPWIKLHKSLLDNFDFQRLQLASRALAPMFWLLASESEDGSFSADTEALAFRLRASQKDVVDALTELIEKGFLIDASGVLADCKRDAMPEKSREEKSREEKALSGKADVLQLKPKNAQFTEAAVRVIAFLNTKTGKAFKPVPANIEFIVGRLKEGATEQDCKSIIARQCREWLDNPDMRKYLRPETLFNRKKFAQYQGELVEKPEPWAGAI